MLISYSMAYSVSVITVIMSEDKCKGGCSKSTNVPLQDAKDFNLYTSTQKDHGSSPVSQFASCCEHGLCGESLDCLVTLLKAFQNLDNFDMFCRLTRDCKLMILLWLYRCWFSTTNTHAVDSRPQTPKHPNTQTPPNLVLPCFTKLPLFSLAACITAKWSTWHRVTKRFLKRNSALRRGYKRLLRSGRYKACNMLNMLQAESHDRWGTKQMIHQLGALWDKLWPNDVRSPQDRFNDINWYTLTYCKWLSIVFMGRNWAAC